MADVFTDTITCTRGEEVFIFRVPSPRDFGRIAIRARSLRSDDGRWRERRNGASTSSRRTCFVAWPCSNYCLSRQTQRTTGPIAKVTPASRLTPRSFLRLPRKPWSKCTRTSTSNSPRFYLEGLETQAPLAQKLWRVSRILDKNPFEESMMNLSIPQMDWIMAMHAADHPKEFKFTPASEVNKQAPMDANLGWTEVLIGRARQRFLQSRMPKRRGPVVQPQPDPGIREFSAPTKAGAKPNARN